VDGKQKLVQRRSERQNSQEALLLLDSTHNSNYNKILRTSKKERESFRSLNAEAMRG
jgi:hypothetical protein